MILVITVFLCASRKWETGFKASYKRDQNCWDISISSTSPLPLPLLHNVENPVFLATSHIFQRLRGEGGAIVPKIYVWTACRQLCKIEHRTILGWSLYSLSNWRARSPRVTSFRYRPRISLYCIYSVSLGKANGECSTLLTAVQIRRITLL